MVEIEPFFRSPTTSLTDIGCRVRCVRRETLRRMQPFLTLKRSFFGRELRLLSSLLRTKIIRLPVDSTRRVVLGLRMVLLILDDRRAAGSLRPAQF